MHSLGHTAAPWDLLSTVASIPRAIGISVWHRRYGVPVTGSPPLWPGSTIFVLCHYCDVIMSAMASQITNVSIVCSTVNSGADQRKHQSSASLAFVRGIHRWLVDSPHNGQVTRKIFPFDDVIMIKAVLHPDRQVAWQKGNNVQYASIQIPVKRSRIMVM